MNKSDLHVSQYLEMDLNDLDDPAFQERSFTFLGLGPEQRKRAHDYLVSERPKLTRVPVASLEAFEGLDDERRYNLRSMFYAMLDSLGDYAETVGWDETTIDAIDEMLGTLPREHGYEIHMPTHHLESLVLQWAKTLEEYRHTAEYHQKNAAYWAEQGEHRKIGA